MAGVASSLNKVGGIQHKSTWLSADIRLYFITVLLDPMGQILAYLLTRARKSPQDGKKFRAMALGERKSVREAIGCIGKLLTYFSRLAHTPPVLALIKG